MKKLFFNRTARFATVFILLLAFSATLTSCVVHRNTHHTERRNLPPGQEKKLRGDRSAKRYAPGQQKKQYKQKKHHKSSKRGR